MVKTSTVKSAPKAGKTQTGAAKQASHSRRKKGAAKPVAKAVAVKKKTTKQSLPKLKKSVQALANRYARERDCFGSDGATCISCPEWFPFEKLDGGHFIPSTVSSTRFDERNIHAQCHRCNRFLHGNIRPYFRGLEKKLGRDELDDLESIAGPYKWTREELEGLRSYYRKKLADIALGIDPRPKSTSIASLFLSE